MAFFLFVIQFVAGAALASASSDLPSYSFLASNQNGAVNRQDFLTPHAFALPKFIPVVQGRARDSEIRLRIYSASTQSLTCRYRAKNQTTYALDFCGLDPHGTNLKISPDDTLIANVMQIEMNSCGLGCPAPAMQLLVSLDRFNEACGGFVVGSLHLFDDLHCQALDGPVLQWSGTNGVIDGNGHSILARNSSMGIFISGENGEFTVKNLDLSRSGVTGPQVFVASARKFQIRKSNLSYSAPATPNQERVALHLYRVENFSARSLEINTADVAIKVATEGGMQTNANITKCSLRNSVVAGIMLQSYDTTRLGNVSIQRNDLKGNPAGYSVWQVGTTKLGAGSSIKGNTQ